MQDPIDIPVPTDSGGDGTQLPALPGELVLEKELGQMAPLTRHIVGVASRKPTSFGGPVAAEIFVGATLQMAEDLKDQKSENKNLREKIETLSEQLRIANERNVLLTERLRAGRYTPTIKSTSTLIGTTLVGVAIETYKANQNAITIILAIAGLIAIAYGLFPVKGAAE